MDEKIWEYYYKLGKHYQGTNRNQAYLCLQNALYYCDREEECRKIEDEMEELCRSGQVCVNHTAIVIVSYNSCYLMQKNIESIRQTLPKGTYHIIVVDNASDDGVAEWLQTQEDIILIRNRENLGFAKACNQGVAATLEINADSDDIFLLNNDTRLAQNSLFWLRMGLYENERIGAVGSYSNYAGNEQQLEMEFSLPADYLKYGVEINVYSEDPYEERVRLSGFAMLIRRAVWDRTGGFDEEFSPGYFEDDDLSMKIVKSGYRLVLCKNSFIYHAGSQSFSHCEDVEDILIEHHQLFMQKYGFDILEYAYPDKEAVAQIPFAKEDEFNLLQVGCGLGAELNEIRRLFPKANVVGIESDPALYQIVRTTHAVFPNVAAVKAVLKQQVFHVLYIAPQMYGRIAREDMESIAGLCRNDCVVIPKKAAVPERKENASVIFENIKMVIWDLDHTFWDGILSEGGVRPIKDRIDLVKNLADCGIMNSISSKNEEEAVLTQLRQWAIDEYFVFPDINWENKGEQIRQKLEDMGLRAENVLFIDDDVRNLEEAKYYNVGIMTGKPDIIPELEKYVKGLDKTDLSHKRLERYRVLEKKHRAQESFDSKEQFLRYSEIILEIGNDCLCELDRISELVARTNQLNYTKIRDSKEELEALFSDRMVNKGYIKVKDRFGDYGVVGFYCFEQSGDKLRHFLFSCRVIGMGIEQCVYSMLGAPDLDVAGPISAELIPGAETPWIRIGAVGREENDCREVNDYKEENHYKEGAQDIGGEERKDNRVKILFKGPCDLSAIESYLSGGDLVTEFNYINDRGFITTGQNHSMHIWESAVYSEEQIDEILADVPFLIKGDFQTSLFQKKYHVICYSLLPDCHTGLYRNKRTGAYISFGSKNFDLTAPENWEGYINGSIVNHAFPFTEEIISKFAENWEFVGVTSKEDLIRNLDYIYTHVLGEPIIILLLGSEIEYGGINEEFADHAEHHREINDLVKAYAENKTRIKLIEMTDYIKSQDDYEDSINHFSRNVYYDLATAVCSCINENVH